MSQAVPTEVGGHAVRVEDVPDPQVRRRYTARWKLDVLAEHERLDMAGKGALLRREGLYTSLITAWREHRDKGALAALAAALAEAGRSGGGREPAAGGGEHPTRGRVG